jgi:hypothetical protein
MGWVMFRLKGPIWWIASPRQDFHIKLCTAVRVVSHSNSSFLKAVSDCECTILISVYNFLNEASYILHHRNRSKPVVGWAAYGKPLPPISAFQPVVLSTLVRKPILRLRRIPEVARALSMITRQVPPRAGTRLVIQRTLPKSCNTLRKWQNILYSTFSIQTL